MTVFVWVDAGGLKPNTWQQFERLSSSWNQAKLRFAEKPDGATDDEPGVVADPRRRLPTILTILCFRHQSHTVGRAVEAHFWRAIVTWPQRVCEVPATPANLRVSRAYSRVDRVGSTRAGTFICTESARNPTLRARSGRSEGRLRTPSAAVSAVGWRFQSRSWSSWARSFLRTASRS